MRKSRVRITLAAVAAAGTMIALPATFAPQANAFSIPIHGDITDEALSFLTPAVLADIHDEHLFEDTANQFNPAHHFDACTFTGGADQINDQYLRTGGDQPGVVAEFQPGASVFDATDEFGQLLHQTMDFYAHSNWVEMGRDDLVDAGMAAWPRFDSWSLIRPGVVVGQGKQLPAGWTASNAENPLVPTVTTDSGETAQVLITGTTPGDSGECLDQIAVGHWGSPGLHKDDPSRPNHQQARSLAVRQTQHEWCRALHLAKSSAGGYAASSVPMGLWVDPNANPHPAGSGCAEPERGPFSVTVALTQAKVLDDTDPIGSGEINLNLVGYRKDFTDSARRHVGPVSVSSGSQVPASNLGALPVTVSCVADPADVVATLQGWDDDNGNDGVLEDTKVDPDDVLTGLTVQTPDGEGSSQVTASSGQLNATFEITRTRDPNC